jgi:hypothetical protein
MRTTAVELHERTPASPAGHEAVGLYGHPLDNNVVRGRHRGDGRQIRAGTAERPSTAPRSASAETPDAKLSPNFSPTLTPPVTWPEVPVQVPGCPRPGAWAMRAAPDQVFWPGAMGRSTAATRSERASLPNPLRAPERSLRAPMGSP